MKFQADGRLDLSDFYKPKKPTAAAPAGGASAFGTVADLVGLRDGLRGVPGGGVAQPRQEALSVDRGRTGGTPAPSPAPQTAPQAAGDLLGRLMGAIRTKESGGNYNAKGLPTKYGVARGAYQFLPSTYAGAARGAGVAADWSQASQDAAARYLMGQYLQQFGGDPAKVAVAWYAGPGRAKNYTPGSAGRAQTAGGQRMPSIDDYARAIIKLMG